MITPLDIKKHDFPIVWRGYDPGEVRAVLDSVAHDFEELVRQNVHLSERLKVAEERLNHYRLIEKTLQDAAITMQTTLEEKVRSADKEAELVIQQARQRANEELGDYRTRVGELRGEIHMLENQKKQFFYRLRGLLKSQTQLLEAMMDAEEREDTLPPQGDGNDDVGPGDFRLAQRF